jgi:intracellular multiplication protein IcmK
MKTGKPRQERNLTLLKIASTTSLLLGLYGAAFAQSAGAPQQGQPGQSSAQGSPTFLPPQGAAGQGSPMPTSSPLGQYQQQAQQVGYPQQQTQQVAYPQQQYQAAPSTLPPGYAPQPNQMAQNPPPPIPVQPLPGSLRPGEGLPPAVFNQGFNQEFPLSTDQVKTLKKQTLEVQKAYGTRVGPAPKASSSMVTLSLEPGKEPFPVRLDVDTVTTLVFIDATGQPWPVRNAVPGRERAFNFTRETPNTLSISPTGDFVASNVSVFLEGAPAPLILDLITNQKEVDYRIDIKIKAKGPNASTPIMSGSFAENVPAELSSALYGISPKGAFPLKSSNADVQAWSAGKFAYVRTKALMASPAPIYASQSADGMWAYQIPGNTTVLLINYSGNTDPVVLSGYPTPVDLATNR